MTWLTQVNMIRQLKNGGPDCITRSRPVVRTLWLVFCLQLCPLSGLAQGADAGGNEQEPVPAHLLPCLEAAPSPPGADGEASVVIKDRGDDCAIEILFEKQADLEKYRDARIRAKLSPDYIELQDPDGSVHRIPLELRRKSVW